MKLTFRKLLFLSLAPIVLTFVYVLHNTMPLRAESLAQRDPLDNIIAISTGDYHTCGITTSGGVKCWGNNYHGELGNGSTQDSGDPVDVEGLAGIATAVSAGSNHTCAVLDSNNVQCWGNNTAGQLGNGTTIDSSIPVTVSNPDNFSFSAIASGGNHTCALTTDGAVKCWGFNNVGQLGISSTSSKKVPTQVTNLEIGVSEISAGYNHNCARLGSPPVSVIKCWGDNSKGQLGDGTKNNHSTPVDVVDISDAISQISAGFVQTCVQTNNGGMKCWGDNVLRPTDVSGLGSGASNISASGTHRCAIKDASLYCWDENTYGQTGQAIVGTVPKVTNPTIVSGLLASPFSVAVGLEHTCVVLTDTRVQCWGLNRMGQLGNGEIGQLNPLPQAVISLNSSAVDIASGYDHTCVVLNSGSISCWGQNDDGQLGIGNSNDRALPAKIQSSSTNYKSVVSRSAHTCALLTDGIVKCWGNNTYGQLGDGSTLKRDAPVNVLGLSRPIQQIAAGAAHTCALNDLGAVQCWGVNSSGELGADTPGFLSTSPLTVTYLASGVAALSAGYGHTCALMDSGEVNCWGRNQHGQLGDGSTTSSSVPIQVIGLEDNVKAIVSGESHTCALLDTGAVKCWGYHGGYVLASGTNETIITTPVDVANLNDRVQSLFAGLYHTCALYVTNNVACWGSNTNGQLGDGTRINRNSPVAVAYPASDLAMLSGGRSHTCSLNATGMAHCWGGNYYGQLGDGNAWSITPVMVTVETSATCFLFTLSHVGNGSLPGVTPSNSDGCAIGYFKAGESISLLANPADGWYVNRWTGSNDDSSNSLSNSVTMPATNFAVEVEYKPICYSLALSHTGTGNNPNATPANTTGCATGQYAKGEQIHLSASPALGWQVDSWYGTSFNASRALTNTAVMPAANHLIGVIYKQNGTQQTASPEISFSATSYEVNEQDRNVKITVTLSSPVSTTVSVNYATANGSASEADYSTKTGTLNFLPGTTVNSFLVAIADDEIEEPDETIMLTLSTPTSATIIGANPALLTILDNDVALVVVEPTVVNLDLKSAKASYEIVLQSAPINAVTITTISDTNLTLNPDTLIFTPETWNTPQIITIDINQGVDAGYQALIRHTTTSSDPNYHNMVVNNVLVNVLNEPINADINFLPNQLTIAEGGRSVSYSVMLTKAPSSPITLTVEGNDQVGITPGELRFDSSNWNQLQVFTVVANDDFHVERIQTITLTHQLITDAPEYTDYLTPGVVVSILDNDVAQVNLSHSKISLTEGGSSFFYEISLTSRPYGSVNIAIETDTEVAASSNLVAFTPENWNSPQRVSLQAQDDARAEGNHESIVHHRVISSDADYAGVDVADLNVLITDNDLAMVPLSRTSMTLTEGDTAYYEAALASEPLYPVTVTLILSPSNQLSIDVSQLTFNASNWRNAQKITIQALDDQLIEHTHSAIVSHSVESLDSQYSGIFVQNLAVTIIDNDSAGVAISRDTLPLQEGSAPGDYNIHLTTRPSSVVTISVEPDSQVAVNPAILHFDEVNWNQPQAVTVWAPDDQRSEGEQISAIRHQIDSEDLEYARIDAPNVIAYVTDPPNNATWTLLIYAAADNDLDRWMNDNIATNGMLYRLFSAGPQERVNVAILFDGENVGDTRLITIDDTGRSEDITIPAEIATKVGNGFEATMDEGATLQAFISWGLTYFQSDYYALSLVDHANGIAGLCMDRSSDVTQKAWLTLLEVQRALKGGTSEGQHPIHVLYFNGSSLGLLEDAAVASEYVHYVVASPNTHWAVYAYDVYRKLAGNSPSPQQFAEAIARNYVQRINIYPNYPYSIAVYNMAYFRDIYTAMGLLGERLASDLQQQPTDSEYLKQLYSVLQKYDSGGITPYALDAKDIYVDIHHFAESVAVGFGPDVNPQPGIADAADGVLTALDSFIVYYQKRSGQTRDFNGNIVSANLEHTRGLAIYFPPDRYYDVHSDYMKARLVPQINADWGWIKFLLTLYGPPCSSTEADCSELDQVPVVTPPVPDQSATIFLPIVQR